MHDQVTIQKFIALRASGLSYAKISKELEVSNPTLIAWSRKYQFEIQNLQVVREEAMQKELFAPRQERLQLLAKQHRKIEDELDKRTLEDVPTARLITLASALRSEIAGEEDKLRFCERVDQIPAQEDPLPGDILDWKA